jgi:hypothetical protein
MARRESAQRCQSRYAGSLCEKLSIAEGHLRQICQLLCQSGTVKMLSVPLTPLPSLIAYMVVMVVEKSALRLLH